MKLLEHAIYLQVCIQRMFAPSVDINLAEKRQFWLEIATRSYVADPVINF